MEKDKEPSVLTSLHREIIGMVFTKCCQMLDNNEDPRQAEIPELVDEIMCDLEAAEEVEQGWYCTGMVDAQKNLSGRYWCVREKSKHKNGFNRYIGYMVSKNAANEVIAGKKALDIIREAADEDKTGWGGAKLFDFYTKLFMKLFTNVIVELNRENAKEMQKVR